MIIDPIREKREVAEVHRVKRFIDSESANMLEMRALADRTTSNVLPTKKDLEGNASGDIIKTLRTREVRTRIFRKVNNSALSIDKTRYTLSVDKLRHFGQYSLKNYHFY